MKPGPSDPALETPLLQKLQGWGVAFVLFFVISQGVLALNLDFFTHMPQPVGEAGGGMGNAIAIFAVLAYGVFFIAAFALPETRGRVLHADT